MTTRFTRLWPTLFVVTLVLLALAAFFIYRIASQKGKSAATRNVEQPAR